MNTVLFKSKIFEHNTKKSKKHQKVELCMALPLILFFVFCFVSAVLGFPKETIKDSFWIMFISTVIINVYHQHYNKYYYGKFVCDFILEQNEIIIGENAYNYSEVNGLQFTNGYYHGMHKIKKGNDKRAIQNTITFNYKNEEYSYLFLLESLNDYQHFMDAYIFIFSEEKIKYNRNNFYNIPEIYRKNVQLENFIARLIKERRMDCTEGLLIIGYDSDEEAKKLREKYCSN
jgi:hypothetical protein